jgi:VCBS repeat-containing protein
VESSWSSINLFPPLTVASPTAFSAATIAAWNAAPSLLSDSLPYQGRSGSLLQDIAPPTLAFIDSTVQDYAQLATAIAPHATVYVLNPLQDAVSQITQTLLQHQNITSVHLLSHGSSGNLQMGRTQLNTQTLSQYAQQLQSWATVLTPDADILLYGCEVGAGEFGQAFLQQFAQLTGADLAASSDRTGNVVLGGDWELEVHTGEIAANLVAQAAAIADYQYILPTQLISIQNTTQGNRVSWTASDDPTTWKQTDMNSHRQSISDDGRYIVFTSQASNLAGTDTNAVDDVFLRDVTTGETILVSAQYNPGANNNNTTIAGSGRSFNPVISANGRFVAFSSTASDLVANDGNGAVQDIFLWDRDTRRTTLISRGNGGKASEGGASGASISGDGKRVVFATPGNLLGNGDYFNQVFVYEWTTDPTAGSIRQVSINSAGQRGDQQSALNVPALISKNGRYVVFESDASNLIDLNNDNVADPDLNNAADIFVRDLETNRTILVSVDGTNSTPGNQGSSKATISDDGRFVAFLSNATNLVASGTTNGGMQVFVRDLQTNTTQQVSVDSDEVQAFDYERASQAAIAGNGQFVVFTSYAKLSPIDTNGDRDVYLRDLAAGTTSLVSVNQANTGGGNGASGDQDFMLPGISADGRYIVFSSTASNLVSGDTNGQRDVFLRDHQTNTTTLLSRNQAGTNSGNGESNFAVINAAGNVIAFTSAAADLVATDTNGWPDVFMYRAGNQPPIAVNDSISGDEDTVLTGNVLANDNDPDNHTPLAATLVTAPSTGSLSLNPNGSFSYTPDADANGTETFTYFAQDALGAKSNTATVLLTVNPVNDAPSFVIGANQSAIAGSGSRTVINWATGFNPGAANESSQTIAAYEVVSNSNPAIFAVNPSVNTAGTLTYTPANTIASTETAVIGVSVRDNGGTANGGIDQSPIQSFTITVTPTPPQPTLSVTGVSQPEGNSGNTAYTFTVSLSTASTQTISVNYATSDGTARVTEGDYLAASGILRFLPGETSKAISVTVLGDTQFEFNETFNVTLSNPVNALIGTATAIGTIVNDDTQPTIGVSSTSRSEGNTGNSNMLFTVTLSNASDQTVSVSFATNDGTATLADGDYLATAGTVRFLPGETQKTIPVSIVGDRKIEPNETLTLALQNPVNGILGTNSAIGTIINDDSRTNSDFNQDGIDDIVWRNYTTGENQLWLMNATLPTSIVSLPSAPLQWVLEGVGDFNQDGNPDLLWREYIGGTTGIWMMAGSSIQSITLLPTIATNWQIEGVGDLDGDGQPDIVWRDVNTGYTGVWYMNGIDMRAIDYLGTVNQEWALEAIADTNNDGRLDLLWRSRQSGLTGSWLMYGSPGATFFQIAILPAPTGNTWDVVDTGDYNRDGKTDVIWRNHATGHNIVWLMDGTRTIGQLFTQPLTGNWFGV